MLSALWLVVLGQPVFLQPLPQAADVPAALALASGRVAVQRPCLSLRCLRAGWLLPRDEAPDHPGPASPFARWQGLPGSSGHGLSAPATRRDWIATDGHDWRVGARYGFAAVRDADTTLRLELGGGYRLQPYIDDGIAATGPVARGRIDLTQQLGPDVVLTQQLRVESGHDDTFLRNAVAIDVQLLPSWTLRSRVETRRDSAAADSQTAGSVQLRYSF